MDDQVFVTGATGKVGRALVGELLAAGASVRALVRSPSLAGLPAEVDLVAGDLSDPSSVRGVDAGRVFLLWPFPGVDPGGVVAALAGADRVVYLSSSGVVDGSATHGDPITAGHAAVEAAVAASGVPWTFLRPGGFASNTLGWAEQIRTSGVVRQPFAGLRRPLVHERDIAAVAVRALLSDDLVGARPVLTGPSALTQVEQAAAIGDAVGRVVTFEEIPVETARREWTAAFGDAAFVDSILTGQAGLLSHPEPVTGTVADLLGRPALPFSAWAADHAAAFR